MKSSKLIIATVLLATVLCSAAFAHHYICEFCGAGVSASNMPQPGNSCQRNPSRNFHSWVMDTEDGISHKWTCAFCGNGVTATHMPQPGNSCSKNPAGKFHRWMQND